jgi:hypothetical protein
MNGKRFFIILVVLSAVSLSLSAATGILDILNKGGKWTLNVDGETGTLMIGGGKSELLPAGGYTMNVEVKWDGRAGDLSASSSADTGEYRVVLVLTRKNGMKVRCEGWIARETDKFMAGESVYAGEPQDIHGAWYALKSK